MLKISKMSQAVEHSLSRELFNRARSFEGVIDLTLGDPDLMPPEVARAAACRATIEGRTRYSANAGLPELRDTYSRVLEADIGVSYDSSSEVAVTVGGMEALFLTLACTLNKGDEVVIFAPYYVNYIQMVRMLGAVPVLVDTHFGDVFRFDEMRFLNAITNKTALIIVNSPCNPTGLVFNCSDLEAIARVAIERDLFVVSDEVYKTLLYDGRTHISIASLPGMQDRTVVIDSVSKRFCMTGYRVGFAAGPDTVIGEVVKMQENVAACAPLPSQYAALSAYEYCTIETSRIATIFQERRDAALSDLAYISGVSPFCPQGAFYLFVNVKGSGINGTEFAYALLERGRVAVVPGETYGAAYKDFVRIACTVDISTLQEACSRIRYFVDGMKVR